MVFMGLWHKKSRDCIFGSFFPDKMKKSFFRYELNINALHQKNLAKKNKARNF